jgi:hypothetical protein
MAKDKAVRRGIFFFQRLVDDRGLKAALKVALREIQLNKLHRG